MLLAQIPVNMVSGGHTSGVAVDVVIITFTVIGAFLTVARLYTRKLLVRNAGIDDVLITIGVVSALLDQSVGFTDGTLDPVNLGNDYDV